MKKKEKQEEKKKKVNKESETLSGSWNQRK